MDNSTVLGFPDTSGDYKGLLSKYRTPYKRETLPRSRPWVSWTGPNIYVGPRQLLLVQCFRVQIGMAKLKDN